MGGLHRHADAAEEALSLRRLDGTGGGHSVRTHFNARETGREGGLKEDKHLNEGAGLVQGHVGRGDVQAQPGRLLPLQAAGALPLRFSHLLCPPPGLPAARRQETGDNGLICFLRFTIISQRRTPSQDGARVFFPLA